MDAIVTWWNEGRPLVSRWTHTKDGMDLTWVGYAANCWHAWTRWVRWSFWRGVSARREDPRVPRRTVVWCRLRSHPAGIVYYSSGLEPDYSCKNCGDELEAFIPPRFFTRQAWTALRKAITR